MEVSQEALDMTTAIRLVTLTLILSLTAGALAPVLAQQPAEPAPALQPDRFQERMRATRDTERHEAAYNVGAGIVNVFLIPGRAITCVLGGAVGIAVLALTLGSGYRAATAAGEEGCGGKWIVTGEDLWPTPPSTTGFDWERR
jgi:hypothetical protein